MDQVKDLKSQGNIYFQESKLDETIQSYTNALQELRSIPKSSRAKDADVSNVLESTVLSIRVACYLKQFEEGGSCSDDTNTHLHKAMEDCTSAFSLLQSSSSSAALMEKILYQRARAHFLLGELNPAAQDLLTVLSIDRKNIAASKLLNTIRLVHANQSIENAPLARLVRQIKEETGTAEATTTPMTDGLHLVIDKVKALFSLLSQDTSALAWEFGRIGGFQTDLGVWWSWFL
jgi:tetratricopeptide (TPR) repeat protein